MTPFFVVVALVPLLLVPLVYAVPVMSITLYNDQESQNFVLVGKPLLYVNGTNYHVKVMLKSVAKYTLPNVGLDLNFLDKKTGILVNTASGVNSISISPNQTGNFDIDTNYTKAQGDKEFPYFNAAIGVII